MAEIFTGPWQLEISEKELKNILLEIGKSLASDGLLMPCTLFYIFVLPLSRGYFDNGEHFGKNKASWKKYMAVYNWIMCIFSAVCFVLSSMVLLEVPILTTDCNLLYNHPWWDNLAKVFYWSKYVEYLDTFFHYVKGGPVTYLHWFHHIGAALNLWFLIVYRGEPGWVFVELNSFVHILMYWYFAQSLSKTGDSKCLNLFKPVITLLQIAQFLAGFYFLWQYPRKVPCFRHDHYKMIGIYYYTWFYVGVVLLLFVNFFLTTYVCRGKKSKDHRRGGKPDPTATTNGHTKENPKKKENAKDK